MMLYRFECVKFGFYPMGLPEVLYLVSGLHTYPLATAIGWHAGSGR